LICIIIAQKIWDDTRLNTPDFSYIIPDFTFEILFNWEIKVLHIIEWRTVVNPSTYCLYYFELRQLLFEIIGPRTTTSINIKYKPVSREYLFKLIEGSNSRGISNYTRIDGLNKIDSLRNNTLVNFFKCENAYQFNNISFGISESKDDIMIKKVIDPNNDKLACLRNGY